MLHVNPVMALEKNMEMARANEGGMTYPFGLTDVNSSNVVDESCESVMPAVVLFIQGIMQMTLFSTTSRRSYSLGR